MLSQSSYDAIFFGVNHAAVLPVTLILLYHFLLTKMISSYVSAGVNYIYFFDAHLNQC